jgi:hypothetical protein
MGLLRELYSPSDELFAVIQEIQEAMTQYHERYF